jgi:hypothetical protein
MVSRLGISAALVVLAALAASATACLSSNDSGRTGEDTQGLGVCFGDSGVCFDFDAGVPPSWPDAGMTFDASFGTWGFDAGAFGGFDASFGACPWLDPKYRQEYQSALQSASLKPCFPACGPSECCYFGLACVPQ